MCHNKVDRNPHTPRVDVGGIVHAILTQTRSTAQTRAGREEQTVFTYTSVASVTEGKENRFHG